MWSDININIDINFIFHIIVASPLLCPPERDKFDSNSEIHAARRQYRACRLFRTPQRTGKSLCSLRQVSCLLLIPKKIDPTTPSLPLALVHNWMAINVPRQEDWSFLRFNLDASGSFHFPFPLPFSAPSHSYHSLPLLITCCLAFDCIKLPITNGRV